MNPTKSRNGVVKSRDRVVSWLSRAANRDGRQTFCELPDSPSRFSAGRTYFFGKPAAAFTSSICLVWRSEWAAMKRSHW